MSLENIPTERLLKWKKNVLKVRRDYVKGTHESYTESCVHCMESATASETSVKYDCKECIWKHMTILFNGNTDKRVCCVGNVISDMSSRSPNHDKQEHIDRCNLWIKTINKELKSRS